MPSRTENIENTQGKYTSPHSTRNKSNLIISSSATMINNIFKHAVLDNYQFWQEILHFTP